MAQSLSLFSVCIFALVVTHLSGCGPSPKPASQVKDQSSNASERKTGSPISVTNWGPTETKIGTPFNVQPSGQSAMWVAFSGQLNPSPDNFVLFGDVRVTNLMHQTGAATFAVPEDAFATAGDKRITIFEAETGRTIDVGVFKVLPTNQ
jgi:hypothetical protein